MTRNWFAIKITTVVTYYFTNISAIFLKIAHSLVVKYNYNICDHSLDLVSHSIQHNILSWHSIHRTINHKTFTFVMQQMRAHECLDWHFKLINIYWLSDHLFIASAIRLCIICCNCIYMFETDNEWLNTWILMLIWFWIVFHWLCKWCCRYLRNSFVLRWKFPRWKVFLSLSCSR